MSVRYGTSYEYDGVVFSGMRDENDDIISLSASFECSGYWGDNVRIKIEYDDETGTYRLMCGANNQMADFMSNSWETWHSENGFVSLDDACEAGLDWIDETQAHYHAQ